MVESPALKDAPARPVNCGREGVVAGGGACADRVASKIADLKGQNEDQNVGIKVALRAMETPLRTSNRAEHCGEEPSVVITQRRRRLATAVTAATERIRQHDHDSQAHPRTQQELPFCAAVRGGFCGLMIAGALVTDLPAMLLIL